MAVRIQFRRGLAADWTASDPILSIGEFGYETDTRLFKIGDGSTHWVSLPYSASTITEVAAGAGLTGGGTGGVVTLSVDSSTIITGVTAGTGLTGGGTGGDVTLNVDTTAVMTGVTAGTGLTGGGTGGNKTLSLDTSKVIQPTIIDSKGDLIVGSGPDTPVIVPLGTNGYALVADSAQTAGVKWAAVSTTGKAIAMALVF